MCKLRSSLVVPRLAAARPQPPHALAPLLHPQMQERRSAVSRQACHAVGELAAACGPSFEPLAVHLLPIVFKTLAMGIQVGCTPAGRRLPPA